MLVSFEEGELLEQSLPGDLVVGLSSHHVLCYLHGFLELCNHNVSCGQAHIIG